jgi:hypothetical protein
MRWLWICERVGIGEDTDMHTPFWISSIHSFIYLYLDYILGSGESHSFRFIHSFGAS